VYCSNCGKEIIQGASFCTSCGSPTTPTHINLGNQKIEVIRDFQRENSSGQGNLAIVPQEIRGWNWGAFFLGWIWGIGNNVWIALLTLIPYVNFVMVFILGANGNVWAWQKRKWDSVEHFKKSQRVWSWWGFGIAMVWLLLIILSIVIISSTPPTTGV